VNIARRKTLKTFVWISSKNSASVCEKLEGSFEHASSVHTAAEFKVLTNLPGGDNIGQN
jgi:hypothetical protein